MRLVFTFTVTVLLLVFVVAGARGLEILVVKKGESQPTWTVNLRRYGYRGARHGFVDDPGSLGNIAFAKNTIAVIFDERSDEHLIPDKGKKVWNGWHLSLVFLGSTNGALIAKRSWIGDLDWHRRLLPTAKGNFLFLLSTFPKPLEIPLPKRSQSDLYGPHPTNLLLLSPTGNELKRIKLPINGMWKNERWTILGSLSGESVLLTHEGSELCEFRLLDAGTLGQRYVWTLPSATKLKPVALSDDYVLFSAGAGQAFIGRFNGSIRSPLTLTFTHAQFLSDDSILELTEPRQVPGGTVAITTIAGKESSWFDLGIHRRMEGATPPFVAANGERFGTVVDQLVGNHFWSRYQRTAYVWQRPQNEVSFKAKLSYSVDPPEAALSPGGSALAVLNAGRIVLYRLPSM